MFVFEDWLIQWSILRRLRCIPNRFWSATADYISGISLVPRSLKEKHRMVYYLAHFHLHCWFLHPTNCLQKQFREANVTRASHLCWSANHTSYSLAKTGIRSVSSPTSLRSTMRITHASLLSHCTLAFWANPTGIKCREYFPSEKQPLTVDSYFSFPLSSYTLCQPKTVNLALAT